MTNFKNMRQLLTTKEEPKKYNAVFLSKSLNLRVSNLQIRIILKYVNTNFMCLNLSL